LFLVGCAGAPAAQEVVVPVVPVTVAKPQPAAVPAPTERNAIALVREHLKPSLWVAMHTELREHAAGKGLVSAFASKTFEEAKIDPATEIDALVSGCATESGCFTLFEHHIGPDRIRRFLEISAEKSVSPAEWLSEDPPSVRVDYAKDTKGVAVLTQVNTNLLLASLRPAPTLVAALQKTRGLEPTSGGYVMIGGMHPPTVPLEDGLSLRLAIAPDGALAGELSGIARDDYPAALVAERSSEYLKRRLGYWWLPSGIFSEDFKLEISGNKVHMPVRIEASLIDTITSGLRLAMRFR
jgi:hypothetical protein